MTGTRSRPARQAAPRRTRKSGGVLLDDEEEVGPREGDIPVVEADEASDVAEEIYARKSAVLLELASSSPATLEGLIQQHASELDVQLLDMLVKRIEVAERVDEGDDVVEGLAMLYRRLLAEIERQSSTPVLRLLDALLQIVNGEEGESAAARVNMAGDRMRAAFNPARGLGIDVFELAQSLGQGDLGAADEKAVEFVSASEFISEIGALLAGAEERLQAAESGLEKMEKALQEGILKGMLKPDQRAAYEQRLNDEQEAFAEARMSITWCQRFHKLAGILQREMRV